MSRIRRLGLVAIMAVALLVGGAPAFATEPLTTDGHITDPDSFLSDEQRATIESPAQSFYSTYNTIIDVVVVPNFSGQKPSDWCKATQAITHRRKRHPLRCFLRGWHGCVLHGRENGSGDVGLQHQDDDGQRAQCRPSQVQNNAIAPRRGSGRCRGLHSRPAQLI